MKKTLLGVVVTAFVMVACESAPQAAVTYQQRSYQQNLTVQQPALAVRQPRSLLESWVGNTPNPDYQISNLSNAGVVHGLYLNTGDMVLDRAKWQQLSSPEQHQVAAILQHYQNRNSPKPITIHVADSAGYVPQRVAMGYGRLYSNPQR